MNYTKGHSMSLHRKWILYWTILTLVIIGSLMLILSAAGVFPNSAGKPAERRILLLGFLVFFLILLFLFRLFTKQFLEPISRVLTGIPEDVPMEGYHSGISELDELVEFIQYKEKEKNQGTLPPDMEELFQDFAGKVCRLTPMERTVLQYYIDGCSIEEVAARAFISVNTVKKHNTNINRKLEVSNREELMLYIDLFRRSGRLEEILFDIL